MGYPDNKLLWRLVQYVDNPRIIGPDEWNLQRLIDGKEFEELSTNEPLLDALYDYLEIWIKVDYDREKLHSMSFQQKVLRPAVVEEIQERIWKNIPIMNSRHKKYEMWRKLSSADVFILQVSN
jgi:hypothetical protein